VVIAVAVAVLWALYGQLFGGPLPVLTNPSLLIEPLEGRVLLSSSPAAMDGPAAPSPSADAAVNAPLTPDGAQEVAAAAEAITIATPELPRVFLDTTYAPNSGGQTFNVPAGGNVQAAINAALPGDTILLQAGATFTGNFTLPNKAGEGWIIIRTSATDAQLPAPGTRITPDHLPVMARLVSPNSNAALATLNGAHHYRFIGVEFTVAASVATNFGIVTLGSGSQTAAQTPHNLIFDRVIIRGTPTAQIQNGMRLNSASTAVIDSWFDNCQATSFESHNIGAYNGPGPYKLVNNYFNAATIPVIFGGASTSVSGLIPSDMEIRGNHFTRPLSWRPSDPSYAGTAWYVKNLFEIKNGQRVLFEGNILEHNWPHTGTTPDGAPQHGYAILLTVRAEGGNVSWATVSDITIQNNIIRKSNVGISLSGTEGQGTHRIRIENNLFDDIGLNWGSNDRSGMLAQVNTVGDLIFNHNTVINDGDIIFANGAKVGKLVFNNNIVNHNAARSINRNYGINAPGTAVGNASLTAKFVEYDVTRNAMANASGYTTRYPAGNFFPSSFAQVQFVDLAGRDYRLSPTSPYKDAGTDGRDIGADMDAVAAATAGAISGVWPVDVEVNSLDFRWQVSPHTAAVAFGSNVEASLAKTNFTIQNLTNGAVVPEHMWSLSYLSAGDEAVLTFDGYPNGVLPDGVYRLTVHAAGIVNTTGGTMAADYAAGFYFLAGDASRDGVVDIADLGIMAANWQQSLSGPHHGDFNYDGVVDIADLGILAGNWQKELDLSLLTGSTLVAEAAGLEMTADVAPADDGIPPTGARGGEVAHPHRADSMPAAAFARGRLPVPESVSFGAASILAADGDQEDLLLRKRPNRLMPQ
jgi:hypothetical protein